MTDHTIGILALVVGAVSLLVGLIALVVMFKTLWVADRTLKATQEGVTHAETAARLAQASLDDLKKQEEAKFLTTIEEGLLRALLDSPGEVMKIRKKHFPDGSDLVILNNGDNPLLKVPGSAIIRLEHLGHVQSIGWQSWQGDSNYALDAEGFKLTPQGRAHGSGVQGNAKVMALTPLVVSTTLAAHPEYA